MVRSVFKTRWWWTMSERLTSEEINFAWTPHINLPFMKDLPPVVLPVDKDLYSEDFQGALPKIYNKIEEN
jgi:hypothetical protein